MAYYIDLFSPETYEAFARSSRDISGFRPRHKNTADKISPGDIFVCYLTRVCRWFGLLQVIEGPFIDNKPIFAPEGENDPFVVRFRVKPIIWLKPEMAPSIHEPEVWSRLSFTRELHKGSLSWTGKVRGSLVRLDDQDGAFLAEKLTAQGVNGKAYPLSEQDVRKLATHTVNRPGKVVSVSVPDDADGAATPGVVTEDVETRESIRIQAMIATIGAAMGLSIWIPRSDRGRVLNEWKNEQNSLLERLPLNYDDTTLRTIEQIDVLWLRGRSIIRAFEVEHTTSVYSGILRMADLLALQPNMDIKLHIVAPLSRKEKVIHEIKRPVFALLENGPLNESCTYLSYDSIRELAGQRLLSHLSDSVLDQYADEEE